MIATKTARMRPIVIPAAEHYQGSRRALAEVKQHHLYDLMVQDIPPIALL